MKVHTCPKCDRKWTREICQNDQGSCLGDAYECPPCKGTNPKSPLFTGFRDASEDDFEDFVLQTRFEHGL